MSHILSRIIGPSNTATKIRVPISDTGHMAQISTANPEILINFHVCSCKVHVCLFMFMQNSCVFMHEYSKYQYQSTSPSVVATDNFG